jgi:hypothetical protein
MASLLRIEFPGALYHIKSRSHAQKQKGSESKYYENYSLLFPSPFFIY